MAEFVNYNVFDDMVWSYDEGNDHRLIKQDMVVALMEGDLSPKSPPALRGVLGVKSLTSSGHLVHDPSLQEFHRCQVAQC